MEFQDNIGMTLADSTPTSSGWRETLPIVLVAALVWYIEKSGLSSGRLHHRRIRATCVAGGRLLFRNYAPEALGLAGVTVLAAALLHRGDVSPPSDPGDLHAWEEIKRAWPLLTTADSLMALQAMLRLMVLISAVDHPLSYSGLMDPKPLAGIPALFMLAAGLLRVYLWFFSPEHALEGPLSGPVNLAFEVGALPILAWLAFSRSRDPEDRSAWLQWQVLLRGLVTVGTFVVLAVLSTQHQIPLAEDYWRDSLFTYAELLELPAAVVIVLETVMANWTARTAFAGFAHAMLPIQQALPWYFFLTAFDSQLEKACIGQPLPLLRITGALQVGLLLFAMAFHIGLWVAEVRSPVGRRPTRIQDTIF